MERYQKSAIFVALSLLVHGVIVVSLVRPPYAPAPLSQPVKLKLVQQTPVPPRPKAMPPAPSAAKLGGGTRRASQPTSQSAQRTKPDLPRRYDQLLVSPAADGQLTLPAGPASGNAKGRLSERLGGVGAQEADLIMGELAFALPIPYAYREMKVTGKAYARLELMDGRLFLETLAGEAHLRAVLFLTLQEAENQKKLRALMQMLKEPRLTVELRFLSHWSPHASQTSHETLWNLQGSRLVVEQHLYPQLSPTGIMLGETILEREKARDRHELRKLRAHRAYLHSLHAEWL